MTPHNSLALTAAAVVLLAFTQPATAASKSRVSFARDIVPLLATRCATCHLTGKESGGLALHPGAAYSALVRVESAGARGLRRVVPFKPSDSYLLMKLEGTHLDHGGIGVRMPQSGEPLTPEELGIIRRWIAEGARNN